jgi:hypothetical protein
MHRRYVRQVNPDRGADPGPSEATLGTVVAALAGLAAAWTAAGSVGLLAHPLQRALTVLLLGIAVVAQRPLPGTGVKGGLPLLLLTLSAAAGMITLPLASADVMAAAVVLAFLAFASSGRRRDVFLATATAVAVFGVYRFAVTAVPWLWLAADRAGKVLGDAAGAVTGRPVWIGATFAGLDFLILTGVLWTLYLPRTAPPRLRRALYGYAALLLAHFVYLILLSYVPDLLNAAGDAPGASAGGPKMLRLLHEAVPWNLPALACVIHLAILSGMLRWSTSLRASGRSEPARSERDAGAAPPHVGPDAQRRSAPRSPSPRGQDARDSKRTARSWTRIGAGVTFLVAILLPVIATLSPGPAALTGKKIVFYEKGFLNWLKPVHDSYGRLSSGMYGMLPVFLESLGAKTLISPDLSEADLKDADVLVLIFPDDPWQEGQLERIHDFARRGGALLVFGEHTTRDKSGSNRFNEVLAPTALQVRFDSATFAVGGWLHSYEALSHPMTAGIRDDQNQFGVVIGASVEARWPARPVLVGRWGWADPGDEASSRAMMGNDRYDAGERLGDVILAAEQPFGKGRIVTFGDTSGLTNAIDVSSYVFTSRLFAYLAGGARAHPAWRQVVALLATLCLVVLLCRRPDAWKTSLTAIGLTASLAACTAADYTGANLLPDGRQQNPNNLAYIDASHLEAYSSESWRPDGIGGLALTLMRNGYLTLSLPELTSERLARAGLLVSIAPSRAFAPGETEAVKTFVNDGGIFIVTVGYDEAGPSRPLLKAFGLRVGMPESESLEPEPFGHFKSPYMEADGKRVYVRFHAAWPVACRDPNAHVFAYGRDNRPVMVMRRFGKGIVLLVGDTCFAMNKNLEYENGAAFEGLRENADFWRWLLTILRNQPMWVPPLLRGNPADAAGGSSRGAAP